MLTLFLLSVALLGSAIAGYYDLKTTDIPDKLVFSMIGIGIIMHALRSFLTKDPSFIISSLSVGGLFTLFGILMYYMGAWGGGDGALLAAIGFLLPSFQPIYNAITIFPFAFSFFINVFLIGSIYSILYSIIILIKNKKAKNNFIKAVKNDRLLIAAIAISAILSLKFQNIFAYIISLLLVSLPLLYRLVKTVEEAFISKISSKKLQEGDMIAQDIPKLKILKRQIRGLTKDEIKKIRRIKKYILIRDGIRYGPVFFLALLATILYGFIPFLFYY